MIVIQDSKVSTVVVWVSTIIIFLLLGLIALMAGIVYNKKTSLEEQLAVEGPVQQTGSVASVKATATATDSDQAAARKVPGGSVDTAEAEPNKKSMHVAKAAKATPPVKTIYVLINGKLVPLEIAAEEAQMVESDLAELKRYTPKPHRKSHPSLPAVDVAEAKQSVAEKKDVDPEMANDNRVVLSQDDVELSDTQSQLQQIAQIAVYQSRKKADVRKLVREAEEHEKQMRLIRVRPGDSLWTIAQRAYGTGFKYKKILEANPQIKDPKQLTVGMILRVPE